MSVDGTWKTTTSGPMGSQDATLILQSNGNELSGSIAGPNGTQEFSGGTIDGDSLSWEVSLKQPMAIKLEFSATVDGDDISGNVKLGSFGNATFKGTREA
ncbi:MAG: hypothetical protein HUJ31_12170 [Pseudomonadales bacterium]|nr:hypothetical protein [Pseudomonadales bacterium]